MVLVRKLFGLLALLCCAISLAAPSAARGAHLFDHVQAPVAVGEFHSHDGHGDADAAGHGAPAKLIETGQDKSGHTHMPGSVSDLNYSAADQLSERSLGSDDDRAAANTPSLTTLGWSPPVRPPRTA